MRNLTAIDNTTIETQTTEGVIFAVIVTTLAGIDTKQAENVAEMLEIVGKSKTVPDCLSVDVLQFRELWQGTKLVRDKRKHVIQWERDIVDGHLTEWICSFGSEIVPPAIATATVEQTKLTRERKVSEFIGNHYRETVPVFSMEDVCDVMVCEYFGQAEDYDAKLELRWFAENKTTLRNEAGETQTVSEFQEVCIEYNPLGSNARRKELARFYEGKEANDKAGRRAEFLQTAGAIAATVWLESRQAFPDSWIMRTHSHPYKGEIRTERGINAGAKIGRGNKSEEWKGRADNITDRNCGLRSTMVQRIASYAVAQVIKDIVTNNAMEFADYEQIKESESFAVLVEELPTLKGFDKQLAEWLIEGKTVREIAELVGLDFSNVAKKIKKLGEKLVDKL